MSNMLERIYQEVVLEGYIGYLAFTPHNASGNESTALLNLVSGSVRTYSVTEVNEETGQETVTAHETVDEASGEKIVTTPCVMAMPRSVVGRTGTEPPVSVLSSARPQFRRPLFTRV